MSKHVILMFHGLGGQAASMQPIADYIARKLGDARCIPVEAQQNLGDEQFPLLGWFVPPDDNDRALDSPNRADLNGLDASVANVHDLVHELLDDGVGVCNIHLFGHSQGGALAIAAGLTLAYPLGSVCTIAGYLALTPDMQPVASGTPYFLHHSEHDDNVGLRWAHYAQQSIQNVGEICEVTQWNIATASHAVHACQLDAICAKIGTADLDE